MDINPAWEAFHHARYPLKFFVLTLYIYMLGLEPSISFSSFSGYRFFARYFKWEVVFDIMHGWSLEGSFKGTASQVFISVGVGIGAKTISMLFFCISKNCRINSMVCSRFLSKILLTTFASTACLSVGNFDRASSMAFWTISRRVASTFLTSFSDRGSNLSTGLRSVLGLPFAWTPIKKTEKWLTGSFHWKTV